MGGLSGGRAAMVGEYSAEELEVARILVMLPRLVWKADHGPPCTHNLRWGARKRRSACGDDPPESARAPRTPTAAGPPPPPCLPARPRPAAEKLSKKRSKEAAAAAAAGSGVPAPSRKDARAEAHTVRPPAGEEAAAAAAATMGTSSPETPLDFCPSAEEADAKARAQACPTDAGGSAPKKPKLKHEHLSKQVDQLSRTRTELQKEAAEIRKQLEALREKNSELMELRIKLEKDGKHHSQQETDQHLLHGRGCLDLLPTAPMRPVDAAHAPDRVHPQTPQQQQLHQHAWPQHWVNNHVVFHQVAPGFSIHPSPPPPAAAEGGQCWRWAGAPAWRVNGDGSVSLAGKVPDLNSNADVEFALDSQQQHPQQQQQQQHPQQQQQQQQPQQPQGNCYQLQQQLEQRRSSPDEHRAARKKRIEMIQRRRNAAGAVGSGASVKVAGFIR